MTIESIIEDTLIENDMKKRKTMKNYITNDDVFLCIIFDDWPREGIAVYVNGDNALIMK